jgi:hypothetical protein
MKNKLLCTVLLSALLCVISINTGFSNQIKDLQFEKDINGYRFYLIDENKVINYGYYFIGLELGNSFKDNTKGPYKDKLPANYIIDLNQEYQSYKYCKIMGIMTGIFGGAFLTFGLPFFIYGLIEIIKQQKRELDLTDLPFASVGCTFTGFGVLLSAIFAILMPLCVYHYKKYNNTKNNIVEILNQIILTKNKNNVMIGYSIKI